LSDPAQIDGVLDPGLTPLPLPMVTWLGPGTAPGGVSAEYAIAWRSDGLYVYVQVSEPGRMPSMLPNLWCGDSVELYVDADGVFAAPPNYDNPGTSQLVFAAPANDHDSASNGALYRDGQLVRLLTGPRWATFPVPGGYVFEAFVTKDDLDLESWDLAIGRHIGFDIGVNIALGSPQGSDCSNVRGQFVLRTGQPPENDPGCDGRPYCNVGAFCTPLLLPVQLP
jgi:hypothetical protein